MWHLIVIWGMIVAITLPSLAQRLIWLGTLPGGGWSGALGVSADGSVVVGEADNAAGQGHAFRWTAAGGMQDLHPPGAVESKASDLSADGDVVVGFYTIRQSRAVLWNLRTRETIDTITAGDNVGSASGVSANGRVVVGVVISRDWTVRAFRWTMADGLQRLGGSLPNRDWSAATAVSADGKVVVGRAFNAADDNRAVRWTGAGGMQDLGTLSGYDNSVASGVSADGNVVVGWVYIPQEGKVRAVRWTTAGGIEDLGPGYALGVSADGSVVVGKNDYAFRWTPGLGMEDLNITFANLLTDGSRLLTATAISDNGRYIVGEGINAATGRTEAFLLDTGPGGPLCDGDDIDNDWICDEWERNGADVNGDGTIDLDLPALGARVGQRDIFVEYDAMTGFAPSKAAINAVEAAFRNHGFELHVRDGGDLNIPVAAWAANPWAQFDAVKAQNFGTPAERNSPNWQNIRRAKRMVFRYCVFAQQYGNSSSSGMAELPGDDFFVTLGAQGWQNWRVFLIGLRVLGTPGPFSWDDVVAGTFMHELGHTLGLRHGGTDHLRYKPNYHSVMNYTWQTPINAFGGSWILDYSAQAFNDLDENALSEPAGIGGHANHVVPIRTVQGWFVPETGPVDWNANGNTTDIGVARDLNGGGLQLLRGVNDWTHLDLSHGPNWTDGVHIEPLIIRPKDTPIILQEDSLEQEMTYEIYQMLSSWNSPPDTVRIIAPEEGATVTSQPEFVLVANDAEGDSLRYHIVLTRSGSEEVHQWWTPYSPAGQVGSFPLPDSLALREGAWDVRVRAMDWKTGLSLWSTVRHIVAKGSGVEEGVNRGQPTLEGSTPNPFNLSTTIRFSLPQREHVTLKVFDVLGRKVATLVDAEMEVGEHSVNFNAEWIPSGVYFAQMKAGNVVQRIKMVLVK
jgi:probable HAF family extracellular repeat protein